MKKKVVLVVLCGVLAWVMWGRKERPAGQRMVLESCSAQAYNWCAAHRPTKAMNRLWKTDRPAYERAIAPYQECTSRFAATCAAKRDPYAMVSEEAHQDALNALGRLQQSWR